VAKKKTAMAVRPELASLVGTQRAALDRIESKHDLAALAAKLAGQHGSDEERALGVAQIERGKREEIEALVSGLAVRAHVGKKVHLSELGGWPACWADERRERVRTEELLTNPISAHADTVTCPRCRKAGDLPSPEETAALHRAEIAAVAESASKKAKRAAKKEDGANATRAKRQLTLKDNLTVRLKIKDFEVRGVVRPDGTMSVKGTNYASPHEAANQLAGSLVPYRIDGFQAWRYEDDEGRWRMLRDHA